MVTLFEFKKACFFFELALEGWGCEMTDIEDDGIGPWMNELFEFWSNLFCWVSGSTLRFVLLENCKFSCVICLLSCLTFMSWIRSEFYFINPLGGFCNTSLLCLTNDYWVLSYSFFICYLEADVEDSLGFFLWALVSLDVSLSLYPVISCMSNISHAFASSNRSYSNRFIFYFPCLPLVLLLSADLSFFRLFVVFWVFLLRPLALKS